MKEEKVERRLRALLRLALLKDATDIHFTRRHFDLKIEMRIQEKMYEVKKEAQDIRLLAYIQYLSGLDVGNILMPQTGQFEYEVDGNILSLRYAVIANAHFTNGVLRILNKKIKLDPYKLSLIEWQNKCLIEAINKDSGLILFSGATGSGKTTTLYSLLKSVKQKKIYTLEDPIEVVNDDFVQISINEAIGFDYDVGIKQIMRHDPDIIMIGEIRDEKSARMAIRAANTGHLVVSSIHATSASGSISRMLELGVSLEQLKDVLLLLSYQKMIYSNTHKRIVLYEMMPKEDLDYYFKQGRHLKDYIDVNKQLRYFADKGIINENTLAQRRDMSR